MFGPNDVHVMVDIETAGTNPGSCILQVGAVAFTLAEDSTVLEGKDEYFKMGISLADSEVCGFTKDSDTIMWWDDQDANLKLQVWGGESPVSQFLYAFMDYLNQFGDKDNIYMWANDPDFDCTLIKAYYVQVGLDSELPWNFRNNRSFRTVKALYPKLYEGAKAKIPNANKHDALSDAIWQAQMVREILRISTSAQLEDIAFLKNELQAYEESTKRTIEQFNELAAQNQQITRLVKKAYEQAPHLPILVTLDTLRQALSAPDISSQYLNRVKAEALREAAERIQPEDSFQDEWFKAKVDSYAKVTAMADAIEKGEG